MEKKKLICIVRYYRVSNEYDRKILPQHKCNQPNCKHNGSSHICGNSSLSLQACSENWHPNTI
jgi:hypothetical protein